MKLTNILSKILKLNDVDSVFGLQGGAVVHIFDSLEQEGLNVIYTMHEQAASLAAVANARVTSNLGCCVTTTGPGSTNAITGLLGAWNDSIPCIFISGQVRSNHTSYGKPIRQFGTQEAPICEIVKPITKKSLFLQNPNNFQEELESLIEIARSGRPGPVWLDIPLEYQWLDVAYDRSNKLELFNSIAENENYSLDEFYNYIHKSKKTLLVLGNGIHLSSSENLCQNFVDYLNIPFVTTWTAQDLFKTTDPRNLGVIGMSGQKGANKAIYEADLLICLGTHLSIPHTTTLYREYAKNAKKIIVNNDSNQLNNLNVKFDLQLEMDLTKFFEKALKINKKSKYMNEWNYSEFKNENWYKPSPTHRPNSNCWNRLLTQNAPDKSCFVVDGGGTALYAGFQSTVIRSNYQRIICSSGMSSMGSGLAESVGVFQSGKFDKIFCIIGDCSFFMNIQDLQTIKQLNIPIVISVINNNGQLAIRDTQTSFQESRYYGTHPNWGLTMPSIESVSKGFGYDYLKIDTNEELEEKALNTISLEIPIVVEILVEEDQPVLFKQKYLKNSDGTFSPCDLSDMSSPSCHY